jgi:recombination protein RecA
MSDGKKKSLENALKEIEKKFGKGSAMRMGDRPILAVEVNRTGSLNLDLALGIQGYPKGRIIEIYGGMVA